jgi:phytoene synthase
MPLSLEESFRSCRAITRARAKNFYYAFLLLDSGRRDAISAIYAFMRHCDDLSDEPGATEAALSAWRGELRAALAGRPGANPIWPGFTETVRRYGIPAHYFEDHLDGVTSDLSRRQVATFDELYGYCFQVASIPGLCLIRIFGYRDESAFEYAEKCGVAFQLTNILRDVGEDAANGRVYLPAADLERFQVDPAGLGTGSVDPEAFLELMKFEGRRARRYYRESQPLLELVEPACRPSLWALIEIYSRLLSRMEECAYPVLRQRVRLPAHEKIGIVARSFLRWTS